MKKRHDALLEWLKAASDYQVSRTGTTRAYLKQIGYGNKTASPEMAARIESATAGAATRRSLRPDDWWAIWPELSSDSQPTPPTEPAAATGEA